METLASLRRQKQSATELQSIVKSMKTLAAANIWQFERAVTSLKDYERTIELGLQIVFTAPDTEIEIVRPELDAPLGAVVFGSEQGMVGQFNDEIARYAIRRMDAMEVPEEDRSLVAIGQRVHSKLENAHQPIALTLRMPTSMSGIRPAVQRLLLRLDAWRAQKGVERIVLFHNTPVAGTRYEAQAVELIPVDLGWLQSLRAEPWPSTSLPTFDMSWDALFSGLIQEYLYMALFRAFVASLSAENASRLSSMEAAESNIEERLDDLERHYHQLRQQSITSELLDIVSGAEAASDSAENKEKDEQVYSLV